MIEAIKTIENLYELAQQFQNKIEFEIVKDDPEVAIERMREVEVIMASSGKLLADAKYWQDEAQSQLKEAIAEVGTGVSPSTLNNWIKSKTKKENYLVNWLERINRSATHLCENLRTVISYRKEEMKNLHY